jgi:hypothetical protein
MGIWNHLNEFSDFFLENRRWAGKQLVQEKQAAGHRTGHCKLIKF